jgi:DNA-binding PadR family transcriptional regulator
MTAKSPPLPEDLQRLVPLTPAVFFILLALAEGEKHGYAIMQDVKRLSDGSVQMGPGTLYTSIQRLLDLSLIRETEGTGAPSDHEARRRYYRLRHAGRDLLAFEVDRMEAVVRRARQKKLIPKGQV